MRPIFGTAGSLGAPGGKCSYCHAPGGEEPNLSDPFDPEEGLVNVAAELPNWTRVIPGDPDNSLLIVKVELTTTSLANGSPMPMTYERLSASEVETVRRWILEGAQDN